MRVAAVLAAALLAMATAIDNSHRVRRARVAARSLVLPPAPTLLSADGKPFADATSYERAVGDSLVQWQNARNEYVCDHPIKGARCRYNRYDDGPVALPVAKMYKATLPKPDHELEALHSTLNAAGQAQLDMAKAAHLEAESVLHAVALLFPLDAQGNLAWPADATGKAGKGGKKAAEPVPANHFSEAVNARPEGNPPAARIAQAAQSVASVAARVQHQMARASELSNDYEISEAGTPRNPLENAHNLREGLVLAESLPTLIEELRAEIKAAADALVEDVNRPEKPGKPGYLARFWKCSKSGAGVPVDPKDKSLPELAKGAAGDAALLQYVHTLLGANVWVHPATGSARKTSAKQVAADAAGWARFLDLRRFDWDVLDEDESPPKQIHADLAIVALSRAAHAAKTTAEAVHSVKAFAEREAELGKLHVAAVSAVEAELKKLISSKPSYNPITLPKMPALGM